MTSPKLFNPTWMPRLSWKPFEALFSHRNIDTTSWSTHFDSTFRFETPGKAFQELAGALVEGDDDLIKLVEIEQDHFYGSKRTLATRTHQPDILMRRCDKLKSASLEAMKDVKAEDLGL